MGRELRAKLEVGPGNVDVNSVLTPAYNFLKFTCNDVIAEWALPVTLWGRWAACRAHWRMQGGFLGFHGTPLSRESLPARTDIIVRMRASYSRAHSRV